MKKDVLKTLCRYGTLSFNEIIHITGYSKSSVSTKLKRLTEEGVVSRIGRYYYVTSYGACRDGGLVLVIKDRDSEYVMTLDEFITTLSVVLRLTTPRETHDTVRKHVEAVWEEINKLIAVVKNGVVITTDEDGRLDASIPSGLRKELEEAVWTVAWAIESLLTREHISDVYIVPTHYTISFDTGRLIIHHNVEWSNA